MSQNIPLIAMYLKTKWINLNKNDDEIQIYQNNTHHAYWHPRALLTYGKVLQLSIPHVFDKNESANADLQKYHKHFA